MEPPRPHKTSFSVGTTSTPPPGGTSAVIVSLLGVTNTNARGLSERVGDNVKSIVYELLVLHCVRVVAVTVAAVAVVLCLPKHDPITAICVLYSTYIVPGLDRRMLFSRTIPSLRHHTIQYNSTLLAFVVVVFKHCCGDGFVSERCSSAVVMSFCHFS